MNVGQYAQEDGKYLPLLDAKLFKKISKKSKVVGKMIACRNINKPKFNGLAMDFKQGESKFSFLARFDRYDVPAIIRQLKSEETDDWIGESVTFILRPSKKGGGFVNAEFPKRKGKK